MQRDLSRQAWLSCSPPHQAPAGAWHQEDAAVLEMVSCTTTDHTTNISPALRPLLSWEQKITLFGKKVLSNKLRGKWCHHISCSQLGGDPVSCQHQYGRSGRKMAQAKVRYRQGQRQVSKPGLWSCQQLRAFGKVSVESTARDAKWEQGFSVGGMGKEVNQGTRRPLFFLCLAHH